MSQNGARDRTAAPSAPVRPHLRASRTVGRWQINGADDLPLLRRAVHALTLRTGAAERKLDADSRLALVATELVTNALKYGVGSCVASISRAAGGWLLDVADASPDSPPVRYLPEAGRPGRNGLLIIDQIAARWGWYVTRDGARKHVWAEVAD